MHVFLTMVCHIHKNEVNAPSVETSHVRPEMTSSGEISNTHYTSTETPAAMRSSFAVGVRVVLAD